MTRYVLGILFSIFFVAAYQGIPQALGQDGCSNPPDMCTSDADCTDPARPACNLDEHVCEAAQNACQSDADCTDPCMHICDMATMECVEDIVEECSSFEDCMTSVSLCEIETCRCNAGYCSETLCRVDCVAEYDSRGDCISTNKDRCKANFPKGQDRKNCEAAVKDFCDCAVDAGCTDKPNGPPVD
jgi:hypothetical protein